MSNQIKFIYFAGEPLGVPVLEELKKAGLVPSLIVCNPDRVSGRGHKLSSPPVKMWAEMNNIEVFQPLNYQDEVVRERLQSEVWDLFVVVAYNFILPAWLLKIPKKGVLNVHPSLLPKLRGASPIRTAILNNAREDIGVTVMLMDEKMDHGPILDQMELLIADEDWPISGPKLDKKLAKSGGSLLASVIPAWMEDEIFPQEQDHDAATYCHKLIKSDAELALDPFNLPAGEAGRHAWRVINAYAGIGDAFFIYQNKRIKIKQADFFGGRLRLLRVVPEGKKEMDFESYFRSLSQKTDKVL